jgi:sterol desaturase/sphingolipid hydroxylase (fatty acid hydroxylase superfamily)
MSLLFAAALGVLTWTLLEYVIHRWMGHDRRFRATPFGKEHVRHHVEGDYFAPTWKKVLAACVAAPILWAVVLRLAGAAPAAAYVAGLIAFYGVYEVHHRRDHTHPGFGAYGRWARKHHFHHHFVDARRNHGVTSPLWDFVFGTYEKPGKIEVPRKLRMAWLEDPSTGAVRADWADTFVLAPARGERRGAAGDAGRPPA